MISCFNHIKDPIPIDEIDVYEFMERIKSPNKPTLDLIEQARFYHSQNKEEYDKLKEQLPCFTLNFSFSDRKLNKNIKAPTGLIYLDVDGSTDIDLTNDYIFASWLSLSNTGIGVLVKVENLTLDNFKYTYLAIAEQLNINADAGAIKATQYNVHSYDKNLYFNEDSFTWICDTTNDTQTNFTHKTPILNRRKKREDKDVLGVNYQIRYNNYDEVDFDGAKYLCFREVKKLMASVFVPKVIKRSKRNSILSAIANQTRALNIDIPYNSLKFFIESVNMYNCVPSLKDDEVNAIVRKAMSKKELTLSLNSPRRFLFNPAFNLSHKEKMEIVNPINGEIRSEKTINKIRTFFLNWDVAELGKLTQKALIKVSGLSRGTIEKYYKLFEEERILINQQYKKLKTS
ncbi:MAG: BT4734/BF3469 family protein [Flavobacteriaceae bacterium]